MTFARTVVEQNIVPYNVLQSPINILEPFFNSFREVLEHTSKKIKNYCIMVPDDFSGAPKYSRNINLLTYVNLRSVHMTYFAHGV